MSGHVGRATAVSWSPDGKRLASGGDDGQVRIWDAVTREEVLTLKGHDKSRINPQFGLIRSLAWSPDGAQLASAGLDGTAKVWEVASGREVFALPADRGPVWSVAWSRNGTHLAAGSEDGTIRIVEGLGHTPKVHAFKAHQGRVRGLSWSPQGDRLASVGGGQARETLGPDPWCRTGPHGGSPRMGHGGVLEPGRQAAGIGLRKPPRLHVGCGDGAEAQDPARP